MIYFLLALILFLIVLLGFACFYLYRFGQIILVFEDDLSDTIESLNECEESLDNVISLRLFFENEQVRPILEAAKDEVGMCRFKIRQMATRFVERSKKQYVIYENPIEVQKIRGIPGAIDDQLITDRIRGFKQELGDDADLVFATQQEIDRYRKSKRANLRQ